MANGEKNRIDLENEHMNLHAALKLATSVEERARLQKLLREVSYLLAQLDLDEIKSIESEEKL